MGNCAMLKVGFVVSDNVDDVSFEVVCFFAVSVSSDGTESVGGCPNIVLSGCVQSVGADA